VLLCDVSRLSEEVGAHFPPDLDTVPVTAAPYFDATCGRRACKLDGVGEIAVDMLLKRSDFAPREYVARNLSLPGQAERFVALWERLGLSPGDDWQASPKSMGPWRYPLVVRARHFKSRARRAVRHLAAKETSR
jgi:hypothetical protein